MSDFRSQTLSLPDQLRWAGRLTVPDIARPGSVLVAGMGGSGISGDFAAVSCEAEGVRLEVVKGYRLPAWVEEERPLVVAVSYSGNTEETLAVVEQASTLGLEVVGISSGGALADSDLAHHIEVPGGNQPRASLGYLLGSLQRVLVAASILPDDGLAEAAAVTAEIYESFDAGPLVEAVANRIVVVWGGSDLTAPVAQRWKTQINENAKAPAWWSVLPEADHNEIVSFEALASLTSSSVVVVPLRDREDHPRVDRRFQHTRALTQRGVAWADEVWSRGDGLLARMLSLTAIADLVSLGLAERYGVDPESVALIDELKQLLKES